MVRNHQVKLAALMAALTLAASGCVSASQGGAGDPSAGTVSPTPSSPEQDAKVRQRPAVLSEKSEEGLQGAMEYWVQLLNYAVASGDTAALKGFSAADCTLCQELIAQTDQAYANGGSIDEGEFRVIETMSTLGKYQASPGEPKVVFASFGIERAVGQVLGADGKATSEIEPVSCMDFEENWDEIAYDEDGNFIGSICSLAVQDPAFDESSGWQPLNVAVNAQ